MNNKNEKSDELLIWARALNSFDSDLARLHKFEEKIEALLSSEMPKIEAEIRARLKKEVDECWVAYLEDGFDIFGDWSEHAFSESIRAYIVNKIHENSAAE